MVFDAAGDGGPTSGQHDLERLNIYIGLVKFVIVSVTTGAVTLYFNHQYQNAQLALEEKKSAHAMQLQDRQAEVEYLSKFVTSAMDKDITFRIDFADYMQSVALTDTLRQIWAKYHILLVTKAAESEKKIAELEAKKQKVATQLEQVAVDRLNNPNTRVLTSEIQDINRNLFLEQETLDSKRYGSFRDNFFDFEDVLTKATTAQRAGDYKEQRNLLLGAVDRAPKSVQPYFFMQLAMASRSLHDFPAARRYMEQAIALTPPTASGYITLAIMQKNDQQLGAALGSLAKAASLANGSQKIEIELITAGYLIHNGQRDEGLSRFEAIKNKLVPRDEFITNIAWFNAVADRKQEFYQTLEEALAVARDRTLLWIDQEVDIDKYRGEERFKALIAAARGR